MLEGLERDGVRVIRQENGGLSAARMTGVRATSARYVMPLDADDALAPGSLAALADALDREPDAVMAWGDIEIWGDVELRLKVGRRLDPWQITHLNTLAGRLDGPARRAARSRRLAAATRLRGLGPLDVVRRAGLDRRLRPGSGAALPPPRRQDARRLPAAPRRADGRAEAPPPGALRSSAGATGWRSSAAMHVRVLFPAVSALPVSDYNKSRLYQLTDQPRQFVEMRRLRRDRAPA